jgi:Uma2 family endonuclease
MRRGEKMAKRTLRTKRSKEPTWEVVNLFPAQGDWNEEDYLALNGNQLVEFSHGILEVLPMPTTSHQLLVVYLYGLVLTFTASRELGTVLVAPLRVRLWPGKFREPDIVFVLREHASRIGEEFWTGADLVMEVVSGVGADRRRDLITKRREYARAGIHEYWIVDPDEERITVLRQSGERHVVDGEFAKGTVASSRLLPGFTEGAREPGGPCTASAQAAQDRGMDVWLLGERRDGFEHLLLVGELAGLQLRVE